MANSDQPTLAVLPGRLSAHRNDVEEEQTRRYQSAVGHGLRSADIDELQDFFKDALPFKSYDLHANIRFIYVMLDKEGWRDNVKRTAERWVQDKLNIQRAAEQVGRQVEPGKSLLRGFCAFRLKSSKGSGWKKAGDWLGVDDHQPQTVVFIALEDLNSTNGFFMTLERGFDVCLDSRSEVRIPVEGGGGLGIFLALDL